MEKSTNNTPSKISHLWDEYKYRHDLIWRLLFQFTTAIVTLSLVPYLAKDDILILEKFGGAKRFILAIPPFLAVLLGGGSIITMVKELDLLDRVKGPYNDELTHGKFIKLEDKETSGRWFRKRILFYFWTLTILSIINLILILI